MRIALKVPVSLLAVGLWLAIGGSAFAARLLTAIVEHDGQTVLQTHYQDDDMWSLPGAAAVWRYLGEKPIAAEQASVEADAGDPLRATLRGDLILRIQHVDRVIVQAKADELTLIRTDPASNEWFLPAADVERIAQDNGIPAMPPPSVFQRTSTWLGLSIAAALVVVVAVVCFGVWLFARARPQPPEQG